jgi:anti-sigma B factor antagonist
MPYKADRPTSSERTKMAVTCEIKNGVGLVTITGQLSTDIADSARNQLLNWTGREPDLKRVVIDMRGVGYMSSAGLGALLALHKRLAERGGGVLVCGLQPPVRTVFDITRADKIFPVFSTVAEAMEAGGG